MRPWCKWLPFVFIQWYARRRCETMPYDGGRILVHQPFPDTVITVNPKGFAAAHKEARDVQGA